MKGTVVVLLVAGALQAQSVMVVDVSGTVKRVRGGGVALYEELETGQGLVLEKGATLELMGLQGGEAWRFRGPGRLRLKAGIPVGLKPLSMRKVAAALQGATGFRPGSYGQAGVVMMEKSSRSNKGDFAPRQPRAVPVLSARTPLAWVPGEAAAGFRFELRGPKGPVVELRTEGAQVRLPEAISLEEGVTYTWTATALPEHLLESPQKGNLRLAPAALRTRMEEARPADSAFFGERLLYAALLAQEGLVHDARQAWLTLAQERPEDPVLRRLAGIPGEP